MVIDQPMVVFTHTNNFSGFLKSFSKKGNKILFLKTEKPCAVTCSACLYMLGTRDGVHFQGVRTNCYSAVQLSTAEPLIDAIPFSLYLRCDMWIGWKQRTLAILTGS